MILNEYWTLPTGRYARLSGRQARPRLGLGVTRSLLAAALLCLLAPLLAPPEALAQSEAPDLTISADETVFPESTAQNPELPEVMLSASDVGGTATRLTLEPSLDSDLFTLGASSPSSGDRITATLSFIDPPDYENPTDTATPVGDGDAARDNIYLVDVTLNVRSGDQERPTETTRIRIRITPVDEYDPVLTNDLTHHRVNENIRGYVVQFHSTDADADGGPIRHEIVDDPVASPDRAHFRLVAFGTPGDFLYFRLPPDYEAPNDEGRDNIYNITVRATSGSPPRTSEPLALTIEIRDRRGEESVIVNTRGTVVHNRKYYFRTGATGVIDTFTIEDSDADEMFSFGPLGVLSNRTDTNLSSFRFNPSSGELSFSGPAPNATSNLRLSATNTSGRTVFASFSVRANHRAFGIRTGQRFPLPENSDPPQVQFTVTDPDDVPPRVRLFDSWDADLFTLESTSSGGTVTATLRFKTQPDFENPIDTEVTPKRFNPTNDAARNNIYLVRIGITEEVDSNGFVGAGYDVRIVVTNVDDGPTLFPTEPTYTVPENTTEPIVTLRGADSDADTLRYEIVDGAASPDRDHFFLHRSTGVLRFASAQNFEEPSDANEDGTYHITVQATSSNPPRTSRPLALEITLTNIDDNPPVLTTTQLAYDAPENSTEPIVTLQATDADGDTLRFEIVDTAASPDRAHFALDPSSGELRFKDPQDFETPNDVGANHTYDITVQATSSNPPRTSRPLALTITLTDDDDNDPTITPTQATYNFLTETTGTIATFTIEDDDAGEAHAFSALEAVSGSGTNLADFNFDPDTGVLSFRGEATAGTSALIIRATSNTKPAMLAITIRVADELALNAPVNQNYTMDTAITELTLPEATGGIGAVTYTLTGPSGAALATAVPGLNFDANNRTLSGTPTTADTTELTYEVTDANGASTSVDFMVIVNASLALDTPANQNYTRGTAITDLELPVAAGGTAPLTYTLTSVPGGLNFNADTRILSGTPNTASIFDLTYEVTDANNASASATFRVVIASTLRLSAPVNQNYTQGTLITGLELPEARGGREPLTYTLTGPGGLLGGLEFDADTRTLSGTPNTAGTTTLTYEVTDANNASTSVDFTVIVSDSLALSARGNQNYTQGTLITGLELPEARGGREPLTYTLTNVPGLTFTADTRILSGTPSTPATTTLTYTVTDANGASENATFMVIVNAGLALSARGNHYTQGTAITDLQLPAATGGTAPLTYTLTSVPGGLTFTADTRILSGTPNTAGTTTLTYEVTDANGASTSVNFTVIVSDGLALSARGNQNYTLGTAITALELPEARGGREPLTYTLTGLGDSALPGDLLFTVGTRTLSGTPNTAGTTILTYEVSDANNASTIATFIVIVSDSLALTASGNQNYTQGRAITDLELPAATGGTAPLTYTLTSVPGLEFDADTRTLSGTPSTADTTTLTYEVTDTNNASTSVTFTVIVNASLTLDTPANQNYTQGTAITLQLPVATGGRAPTYTLTGPGDSALPAGLTFTANTRILSGTPNTAATTTLTYRVTDTNGASMNTTFTVTVNASLTLDTPANQNYTQGTAITALTLPAATGGTAPLTYTLTGPGGLPGGLEFDADTRTLSGTLANTASTFDLTYEVTDDNGASTNATFRVVIASRLRLSAPVNQNYTQGTLITGLELPEARGGREPLTYTLTGPGDSALPGGLTFTPGTRTLSGTPNMADTTTLTYEVTDDNGASTNTTFTVIVSDGLTLTASVNQNYTQGTLITVWNCRKREAAESH